MAEHFPDATKKVDFIRQEAAKAKKIYSVERRELVVPVAEIDWIPPADVVARDCYDRILAENDTMRNQLAKVGKKVGDKMDDVRPVVHGEWKNAHPSSPLLDGGGPPYCSVCGKEAPLRSVEVNQWKLERGILSGPEVVYKTKCFLSNFCPNCGAEMKPNLDTTKGDQL